MGLIEHFEAHCGAILGGYNIPREPTPFQVILLARGPVGGTAVLATLGLSRHELHGSRGSRFHLELIIVFRQSEPPGHLPALVHQVATEILRQHHGPARGDVIGPRGPLRDGASVEALYVALPTYFPDSFHVYTPEDGGPSVNIAWLVPITPTEAAFVRREGWERFESELERQNPDLFDFARQAIALPT